MVAPLRIDEQSDEFILRAGERGAAAPSMDHATVRQIDHERFVSHDIISRVRHPARARACGCEHQFVDVDRLGHDIICTGIEMLRAVFRIVAAGQDDRESNPRLRFREKSPPSSHMAEAPSRTTDGRAARITAFADASDHAS